MERLCCDPNNHVPESCGDRSRGGAGTLRPNTVRGSSGPEGCKCCVVRGGSGGAMRYPSALHWGGLGKRQWLVRGRETLSRSHRVPLVPSLQAFMMRTIESINSMVIRPSEDLWAEICSCLPHPDQKDASEAFTDSFLDSYKNGGSQGNGVPSQPNPKPWAPLNDSEVYLASLGECWVRLWVG